MTTGTAGALSVCTAQLLLGTLGVCVLQGGADPVSTAFYRCLIGALALACYLALRGDLAGLGRLPARVLGLALLSGVLMVGNWILFFMAIGRTGIAVATVVFHVQPFFVVLLAALAFRERLHAATFAWIALALVGLVLATGLAGGGLVPDRSWAIGIGCTLGAALLYAGVTVMAKGMTQIRAPQLALVQCLCGTVLLWGVTPLGPVQVGAGQWGWFALIGIVHTGVVYALLYTGLPKLPTALAAVLLFLYPASAVLVDALVYGHHLGLSQSLGFACILAASLGVTLRWGRARTGAAAGPG
ncbi:EamA family transporter [Pseudooceanicola sp. GBMRC 2024]|uniref:EamA family transporter n=1 Tax=Pseudooceanicola albus TaxID=2692189 RepID=A0A6L7G386_9RHOB|nr:DMT family transporter [Pseudooceanicola albus]MXN17968.1 EamA family transporter [Pseudooceanicola albus]